MEKSLNKLKMTLDALYCAMHSQVCVIDGLTVCESGFKTDNCPPEGDYIPLTKLPKSDAHYWIKGEFTVPEGDTAYDYYLEIDPRCKGWDAKSPQCIIYLDGKMVQGIDVNHHLIPIEAGRSYVLWNYVYTAEKTDTDFLHRVIRIHRATEELYYDMLVPYETCRDVYAVGSLDFATGVKVLLECANLLDLRSPGSDAFYESIMRASEFIRSEYYEKLCSTDGKPTVNCIGHTHIDVEWLWDRKVTRDKIQTSASTVTSLMKVYPEYVFMLSQPELYRYLKESAPEKFTEVVELVIAGRWEPEGAMFVECDCNLTSGEGLVRQILYGKKFFKNEFGTECTTLFLPDVFGYSAALPQILKKSRIDYFITSKISWNDTNTMPYDVFVWRGIDGTDIFSAFITGQQVNKGEQPRRGTTYVGNNNPGFIYGTYQRQQQKEYVTTALNTYGFGDGGGGPTREMLEKLRRLMKGLPGMPVAVSMHIADYMKRTEAEFYANAERLGKIPRWIGELYLEFHRGTYTTAAANKRDNRRAELGLTACEGISAIDMLHGGSYDKEAIDAAWLKVLHDQFHDILPGSSIGEVYEHSARDYAQVLGEIGRIKSEKLEAIASRIDTDGGVLVYNPLGFARKAILSLNGECYVTDCELPALGYRVIKPEPHQSTLTVRERYMENELYRITLDELGNIISLYDKNCEREVVCGKAAQIRFYEDRPHEYDAWELEPDHTVKSYTVQNATARTVRDGDRAGIEYISEYMDSKITKTVWIYNGSPRIDVDMKVMWKERHQIMKLLFPVDILSDRASFEIQYGHTSRPTHRNTSWDAARFEVCAHKWIDISENGYGVALLNDSKYGHSVTDNVIAVSCLRGPTYPYPMQDIGEHSFTVSLIPHEGDLYDAGVIREAYMLNQPAISMPVGRQSANMPEHYSFIRAEEDAIIIEGIKRAEDNDDIIVRLYESFGGRRIAHLTLGESFSHAYLCDLTETPVCELEIKDGCITLPVRGFAIETLRLVK